MQDKSISYLNYISCTYILPYQLIVDYLLSLQLFMPKGKKKASPNAPNPEDKHTLLNWLSADKHKKDKNDPIIEEKSAENEQRQTDHQSKTKKIKKVNKSITSKKQGATTRRKSEVLASESRQKPISDESVQQKQVVNQEQAVTVPVVEQTKTAIKKPKGRKKKDKQKKITKQNNQNVQDYGLQQNYGYLFVEEEVSSTQYIFDKYRPIQLQKFMKDHQQALQMQIQQYEQYPVQQKQKQVPILPPSDGRRYEVPIKVCTCCNFFGKRHLCPHNLCAKPCPVEHRKTKIRDRYFERYKNKPREDDEQLDEE